MITRQEFLSSKAVIELAGELYFDERTNVPKRGAASKDGPGCVRRYVRILQQLMLTYDLFLMTRDELAELLPAEFDGYKQV